MRAVFPLTKNVIFIQEDRFIINVCHNGITFIQDEIKKKIHGPTVLVIHSNALQKIITNDLNLRHM